MAKTKENKGNKQKSKTEKRKVSKKSQRSNTFAQKENVPKNQKNKVTRSWQDPNETIALSKQLLKKRATAHPKRQSRSRSENRVCGNGKPIPSLAELEKMFEDSDEDDQSTKIPVVNTTCTTPSPKKMALEEECENLDEKNLLSPTTINKISEKLLDMISNVSYPIELLNDIPPPSIVPPKKRRKPDEPYIVGCKDRPQVIRKPNTNFCKGDDDYGVQASGDPEEPPGPRAKKSKIANYSKSIFNACSDEIAARLTRDEAGGLSDASTDSNKTIEYDPEVFKNQSSHRFSPLPSTSKDNETFMKNDKLFNDSLKENNDIKDITPTKEENEVQIIDTPYETIVLDDVGNENPGKIQDTSEVNTTDTIQIDKPIVLEDVVSDDDIEMYGMKCMNDDDCVLVPSSTQVNNHNNYNEPIDIDDEYSNINMENITYDQDVIEVIDIDDVIAENKSILDKWKNNAETLDKINTVVDVPNTCHISTPQTSVDTPSINNNLNTTNRSNETNFQSIPSNNSLTTSPYQRNLTTGNSNTSIPVTGNNSSIQTVVTNFFQNNYTPPRTKKKTSSKSRTNNTSSMKTIFDAVLNVFRRVQAPACMTSRVLAHPVTHLPPPSHHKSAHFVNANNRSNGSTAINLSQETINRVAAVNHSNSFGQRSQETSINNAPIQAAFPPSQQTPEASRNLGECPICMDPLSNNGIASTFCGHVFCLKCIQAAIKSNGKRCPTCRKALKGAGGGYHQLYL